MRIATGCLVSILSLCIQAGEPAATPEPALRGIRQITFVGGKNGEAYFSADGSRVVFQGVRETGNPFYQIYSMTLDPRKAAGPKLISSGIGRTTCSFFHPRRNRMLFSSTHLDAASTQKQRDEIEKLKSGLAKRYAWDFDPEFDIFETDLDGGRSIQLTAEKGYDAEGSYSPDGRRIVFCSMRDGGDGEIYVMNADGSHPLRLTTEKGYDGGPFFSPDGKQIVWRHFVDEAQKCAEVWIMNADGSGKKQITSLNAITWAPYWHPNGEWLVFASNFEDPAFDLYAIKTDGSKLTRITHGQGFDGLPAFSPDGSTLMWTSNRSESRSQIFLAALALPGLPEVRAAVPPAAFQLEGDSAKVQSEMLNQARAANLEHSLARRLKKAGFKPLGRDKLSEETEFIFGPSVCGWKPRDGGAQIMVLASLDAAGDGAAGLAALDEVSRSKGEGAHGVICAAAQPDELPRMLAQAQTALKAPANVAAVVSFASLGRNAHRMGVPDGRLPCLLLRGSGTSPLWRKLAEELALRHPGVQVRVEDDPAAAPELASAIAAKLSCVSLEILLPPREMTLDGEEATVQVGELRAELTLAIAASVDFVRLLQAADDKLEFTPYDAVAVTAALSAGARPYLGTIPEYKSEGAAGVKLKGTREGSPAEKSGIKPGDVLVELNGQPVKDVEGYLQALEALKPGVKVKLKVQRDGQSVELSITPTTR